MSSVVAVIGALATSAAISAWTASASISLLAAARLAALIDLGFVSVLDQSLLSLRSQRYINCDRNTVQVAQRKLWTYTAF